MRFDFVTLTDGIDNLLTITRDLSKNGMFAIEPGGFYVGDEELRPIGVLARVRHAEDTGARSASTQARRLRHSICNRGRLSLCQWDRRPES